MIIDRIKGALFVYNSMDMYSVDYDVSFLDKAKVCIKGFRKGLKLIQKEAKERMEGYFSKEENAKKLHDHIVESRDLLDRLKNTKI